MKDYLYSSLYLCSSHKCFASRVPSPFCPESSSLLPFLWVTSQHFGAFVDRHWKLAGALWMTPSFSSKTLSKIQQKMRDLQSTIHTRRIFSMRSCSKWHEWEKNSQRYLCLYCGCHALPICSPIFLTASYVMSRITTLPPLSVMSTELPQNCIPCMLHQDDAVSESSPLNWLFLEKWFLAFH